jgi:hypothetical protein
MSGGNNSTEEEVVPGLDEFLKMAYLFLSKPEAGVLIDSKRMNKLTNLRVTDPFRDVVDWEALELLDYPEIVKHPMDLGTLKVLFLLFSFLLSSIDREIFKEGFINLSKKLLLI